MVEGIAWQWIFWLNVPVGLVVIPLAARKLTESRGPDSALDLGGLALVGAGLFGVTFGIVRGEALGWGSATVLTSLARGRALLGGLRPLGAAGRGSRCCRCASSASAASARPTALSFAMFFGMFGSIFLLGQFFQVAQGYGPLEAGARTLPWTAMPIVVGPDRRALIGSAMGTRPLMAVGSPSRPRRSPGSP